MPNDLFSRKKKIGALVALGLFILLSASFSPNETPDARHQKSEIRNCDPDAKPFYGYTFLYPEIVNKNAAYAPFFLRWGDYYKEIYFDKYRDIQREENINEWIGRFCDQPEYADVETLVYETDAQDLVQLQYAAEDKEKKTLLPDLLTGNTFAEMIAINGCTEVIDYLRYAKRCEPHVTTIGDSWTPQPRDAQTMYNLIDDGMERFEQTKSYFLKLRYAYQMIRLAHYLGNWKYTIELHDRLIPRIDLKKPSIVYYWIIGHVAGAMQKLGKYPEAAYRYSIMFRHCPSKRMQAYRSFLIRNDKDWEETLRLCQSDAERATLYVMRAGDARERAVEEMQEIYKLEPGNPQLDLLLVSMVQELEKIILKTSVTDLKRGRAIGELKRENADKHLLDLQKFVRQVVQEKKVSNPKLWRATSGYIELLSNINEPANRNSAYQDWQGLEKKLSKKSDKTLIHQLAIWNCLLDVLNLDQMPDNKRDSMAYVVRNENIFKETPYFESFLQDWLSAKYADKHPGKAVLVGWSPEALTYNPNLVLLDDLLKLADSNDPVLLEKTMMIDTNPDFAKTKLFEIRGAYLLSLGQPEAALATLRKIKPTQEIGLTKFAPFREKVGEQINRPPVYDSLILTRRGIAEKIIEFQTHIKIAEAENDSATATKYYYLLGLGYYNMSYFGYEWEVMDFFRSGYNQLRLAQGPVFPLRNSPDGNRENTDVSLALTYFEEALRWANNPEMAARATYMAARCHQKMWFCDLECTYRPGSKLIPTLPDHYMVYYNDLMQKYSETNFYKGVVKQCKWLEAYAR